MGIFSLLFGSGYSRRARRDQRSFGTSVKNLISPINHYGTCFSCDGTGTRTFDCHGCGGTGRFTGTCRTCRGAGLFTYAAKPCFRCHQTGFFNRNLCRHCQGTGEYRPAQTVSCQRCAGSGEFTTTCRRCDGDGEVEVSCHKCGGSGWHRF